MKEIKAPKGTPVWRKEAASGSAFALKLTAKGAKTIAGSSEGPTGAEKAAPIAAANNATPEAPPRECEMLSAAIATRAPRAGAKLGRVLVMLSAESGATISELMGATGWLEHSTRAALTGLRRRGYELSLTRGERDGSSVYRIAARGGEAAK